LTTNEAGTAVWKFGRFLWAYMQHKLVRDANNSYYQNSKSWGCKYEVFVSMAIEVMQYILGKSDCASQY